MADTDPVSAIGLNDARGWIGEGGGQRDQRKVSVGQNAKSLLTFQ